MAQDLFRSADTQKADLATDALILGWPAAAPGGAQAAAGESMGNAGGSIPDRDGAGRRAADAGEVARLTARIGVMAGRLNNDFANGRVGERHNSFAHRSRLLSQLTAMRDAMRDCGAVFRDQERGG